MEECLSLRVYPAETSGKTRIRLGEGSPDIMEVEISKSAQTRVTTKVWYNGALKWSVESGSNNAFGAERLISGIIN